MRFYKRKNRLYRNSKLPEDKTLYIIATYLFGVPPAVIAENAGVSERTVATLLKLFQAKLRTSRPLVRAYLDDIFGYDRVARVLDLMELDDKEYCDQLWHCLRDCPKQLDASLENYLRWFAGKARYGPRSDPTEPHIQPPAPSQAQKGHYFIRWEPCRNCQPFRSLGFTERVWSMITQNVHAMRLNRENFADHMYPILIRTAVWMHVFVSQGDDLPHYGTSPEKLAELHQNVLRGIIVLTDSAALVLAVDPLRMVQSPERVVTSRE